MNTKEILADPEFTSKRDELTTLVADLNKRGEHLYALWEEQQRLIKEATRRIENQLWAWSNKYPDVTIKFTSDYRFVVTDILEEITAVDQNSVLDEQIKAHQEAVKGYWSAYRSAWERYKNPPLNEPVDPYSDDEDEPTVYYTAEQQRATYTRQRQELRSWIIRTISTLRSLKQRRAICANISSVSRLQSDSARIRYAATGEAAEREQANTQGDQSRFRQVVQSSGSPNVDRARVLAETIHSDHLCRVEESRVQGHSPTVGETPRVSEGGETLVAGPESVPPIPSVKPDAKET